MLTSKNLRVPGFMLALMLLFVFGIPSQAQAQVEGDLEEMSLEDLLNMEVTTASKSAEKLSDAPGVVTVVTKDELDRFGGMTLSDFLARVPSLVVSSSYFTDRSTIAARGDQVKVTSGHVMLLVNGRPVRETLEGGISSEVLETFPVNIIERIEVIRGPGSVLYGSNAFSAVINVITETAENQGLSVTGVGGDAGTYGALGEVKVQLGDLSVTGAGRYYKKANWETSYRRLDAESGDIVVDQIDIPNQGAGAYLGIAFKGLRAMSTFNQWETQYFVRGNLGQSQWQKAFGDLGYGVNVSESWHMDFNATYAYSTLEASAYPYIERKSGDFVAEWANSVTLSEKSQLVFGGLFNRIQGQELFFGTGTAITISDDSRSSVGVYSQVNYRLLNNLKLIGGLQANKVENVDLDVVPRAGVIWYPAPRINFKALYSQAFRAPSINELDLNHPALRGNPDLTPEKVGTLDVGVNYLGDQFQAGVNVFRSKMTDIIVPDRSILPGLYSNVGEVTFHGVELEGKYYVNRSLFVTGSMLYQANEDANGDENMTPIANFGAKAGISYASEKGFTASIFDVYQGALDEAYDATLNPDPGAYNLVNLHFNFDVAKLFNLNVKQDFGFFVQVDNLLDEEMWLPDWGGISGETIPVNQGRAVYFGVKASL